MGNVQFALYSFLGMKINVTLEFFLSIFLKPKSLDLTKILQSFREIIRNNALCCHGSCLRVKNVNRSHI